MALAKTVAYTPFNKTSFGYATGDLTTPHSGLTNVKVIITPKSGTNHWDDTGHISTTGSGSAVASYNSDKLEWSCVGTLADVAGVLDNLDFFPADFPAVRDWTTKAIKPNETDGDFPIYETVSEEPASDDPIPDTVFDLKVYDADDIGAGAEGTYVVTFDPTQPTFGKQRPYWSTEPTNEDLATTAHGETTGGLIDMGVISQENPVTNVSDTDPLTVTCEFRGFELTSPYPGSAYGVFASSRSSKIFIGDKKPGSTGTGSNRINFTGTKAEVQAYLDNIRYWRCVGATTSFTPETFVPNYDAFDMYFTISNGVVGAEYTKHVWFSDTIIGLTGLDTTQSYAEDTAIVWDFGDYTTSNVSPDADEFNAIITLNSVGKGGVDTFTSTVLGSNTSEVYNSTTGALTITSDTESKLKDALRSIQFTPEADFNATGWTMSVQLNHTGSVNDSSYTSTPQTVTVTSGGDVAEVNYQNNTHTWTEDTVYEFSVGGATGNPEIAHLGDSLNWSMALTLSDAAAGSLVVPSPTSTYGTMAAGGSGVYTLTGTKTEVNAGLAAMQFIPATDYDTSFTIGFAADRTSGNLEHNSTEWGTYTMTATAVGEYSITQLTGVDWNEDEDKTFNSGLAITDTAADDSRLPAYGSDYRLEIAMWYYTGGAWAEFTDGTIVSNYTTNLVKSGAGNENGQGDTNMISYTGPKDDVNAALASLRFIPNVDYSDVGPHVYYKLVRVSDGAVLTDQSNSTRTEFNSAADTEEYSYSHTSDLSWDEDTPKLFDCGVQITDKADERGGFSQYQSDYTASLQLLEWTGGTAITTATINVLSSITGLTTVVNSSGTTITGNKTQVNLALQNLKMIPDNDWISSPDATGKFFTYVDITRDSDSVPILDGSEVVGNGGVWVGFEEGTNHTEFALPSTTFYSDEDVIISYSTAHTDRLLSFYNLFLIEENQWLINDKVGDSSTETYTITLTLDDASGVFWYDGVEYTPTSTGVGTIVEQSFSGTRDVLNTKLQGLKYYDDTTDRTLTVELYRDTGSSTIFTGNTNLNYSKVPTFGSPVYSNSTTRANLVDLPYFSTTYDNDFYVPVDFRSDCSIEYFDFSAIHYRDSGKSVSYVVSEADRPDYTVTIVNDDELTFEIDQNVQYPYPAYEEINVKVKMTFPGISTNRYLITDNHQVSTRSLYTLKRIGSSNYEDTQGMSFNDVAMTTRVYASGSLQQDVEYVAARMTTGTASMYFGNSADDSFGVTFSSGWLSSIVVDAKIFTYTYRVGSGIKYPYVSTSSSSYAGGISLKLTSSTTTINALIEDTMYDYDNDKLYILLSNEDKQQLSLYQVDCDSPTAISSSVITAGEVIATTTVGSATGSARIKSAALGKLPNGDVFFVYADAINGDFRIHHQDTGGTDNFGYVTNITKSDWSNGNSITFNNMFPNGDYLVANTTGYFIIANGLYYYNSGTWTEVVDPSLAQTAALSMDNVVAYLGGITPSYYYDYISDELMILNQASAPVKYIDVPRISGSSSTNQFNRAYGSKYDDVYLLSEPPGYVIYVAVLSVPS